MMDITKDKILNSLSKKDYENHYIFKDHIIKLIEQRGDISFCEFMQKVLYAKDLGYYMGKEDRIGQSGDFVTAPTLSPIFSYTFGNVFSSILKKLSGDASIVEFGAGTGKFALDCLKYLKKINSLPSKYYIIELNENFKIQQETLLKNSIPEYFDNIVWNAQKLRGINGIVFANEILDAMPIELMLFENNSFHQVMVTTDKEELKLCQGKKLTNSLNILIKELRLTEYIKSNYGDYMFEINANISPWIKRVGQIIKKGVVFICDYGYQRKLLYSPHRRQGSIRCYYKHHVHNNPLTLLGVQDITSHVDFTHVAESAVKNAFKVEGFLPQGTFLMSAGIMDCYNSAYAEVKGRTKEVMLLNQDLKKLTLGTELAENFKIMTLSKNYGKHIPLFEKHNSLHLL